MTHARLSYEESCRRLQPLVLDEGEIPPIPAAVPQYDDETLGVGIFRMVVGAELDLSNLTLPRTFFGRSELNGTVLRNTDLTESNLCWNDFNKVDFSHAVLVGADLRASHFDGVNFTAANLERADMRRSWFNNCRFDDAVLKGTVLTHAQGKKLSLSEVQRASISWTSDDGPEPEGG
jgi:BTB/POZ domain-containing protein KCTD9